MIFLHLLQFINTFSNILQTKSKSTIAETKELTTCQTTIKDDTISEENAGDEHQEMAPDNLARNKETTESVEEMAEHKDLDQEVAEDESNEMSKFEQFKV